MNVRSPSITSNTLSNMMGGPGNTTASSSSLMILGMVPDWDNARQNAKLQCLNCLPGAKLTAQGGKELLLDTLQKCYLRNAAAMASMRPPTATQNSFDRHSKLLHMIVAKRLFLFSADTTLMKAFKDPKRIEVSRKAIEAFGQLFWNLFNGKLSAFFPMGSKPPRFRFVVVSDEPNVGLRKEMMSWNGLTTEMLNKARSMLTETQASSRIQQLIEDLRKLVLERMIELDVAASGERKSMDHSNSAGNIVRSHKEIEKFMDENFTWRSYLAFPFKKKNGDFLPKSLPKARGWCKTWVCNVDFSALSDVSFV